jgi:hypothetical protein
MRRPAIEREVIVIVIIVGINLRLPLPNWGSSTGRKVYCLSKERIESFIGTRLWKGGGKTPC